MIGLLTMTKQLTIRNLEQLYLNLQILHKYLKPEAEAEALYCETMKLYVVTKRRVESQLNGNDRDRDTIPY